MVFNRLQNQAETGRGAMDCGLWNMDYGFWNRWFNQETDDAQDSTVDRCMIAPVSIFMGIIRDPYRLSMEYSPLLEYGSYTWAPCGHAGSEIAKYIREKGFLLMWCNVM